MTKVRPGTTSALTEQSALAERYIPQRLREVNLWPVSFLIPAVVPPTKNFTVESRLSFVSPKHECHCARRTPSSAVDTHQSCVHVYPQRIVPNDCYVALKLAGQGSNDLTQRVDDIASLSQYKTIWEAILLNERVELLNRYENYSQYDVELELAIHAINMGPNCAENFLEATLRVHGIADASPPLMIGDTVLVRPIQPVSIPATEADFQYNTQYQSEQTSRATMVKLPVDSRTNTLQIAWHRQSQNINRLSHIYQQKGFIQRHLIKETLRRLEWSAAHYVPEFQGKILSVRRAAISTTRRGKAVESNHYSPADVACKDEVRFSWMDRRASDILMYSTRDEAGTYDEPVGAFNVRFVPSHATLQRCLTALDWMVEVFHDIPNKAMELLFPVAPPVVTQSSKQVIANVMMAERDNLNANQVEFVNMVIGRTLDPSSIGIRSPQILTGPAGTGKTKAMLTAIRAILSLNESNVDKKCLLKRYRILICTPSHTAADVVTRRLGLYLTRDELFRLYNHDRPVATVPTDVLGFCRQSDDQVGAFILPNELTLLNFKVIVCTCSDASLLYNIGLTNQQLRQSRQCLSNYIETLCNKATLSFTLNGVTHPHFTHLFIDEAAQASEPETLVPLSVVVDPYAESNVEIVLVGDPRQLSPYVYSSSALQSGLQQSWMERLLNRPLRFLGGGREHLLGPDVVTMDDWLQYSFRQNGQEQLSIFLTLNYRGHPSFLMIPSVLFYSDRLQSVQKETHNVEREIYFCEKLRRVESLSYPVDGVIGYERYCDVPTEVLCRKQFDWPLHFRGVVGKDTSVTINSGFASSSWVNEAEATVVAEIAVTLVKQGVKAQAIGIMAPFRGQVVTIRKLLRRERLDGVNVGTVEDYQAVEFDIIILSLTRSTQSFVKNDVLHQMGIFGQSKRANVAMTRAEFLFIVVGNPSVMMEDNVWRQFLLFCYRNGLYYGDRMEDESELNWSTEKKVARCLPTSSLELQTHIVTVGTLERLLRKI